jgi:hypothetical protein
MELHFIKLNKLRDLNCHLCYGILAIYLSSLDQLFQINTPPKQQAVICFRTILTFVYTHGISKSSELLDQNEDYELPQRFRKRVEVERLYEQTERLTTSEPRLTACDQESSTKSLVGFPRNLV